MTKTQIYMITKLHTAPLKQEKKGETADLYAEERNKNTHFMLHSNFAVPLFQTINKHSTNALPFILLKAWR